MCIRFLAITRPFLSNRAETFFGNSGDYYLSWFWCFFCKISYFWRKNGHRVAKGSGASKPDQKVCSLGYSFGSTVNPKTCFPKFRASTPPPLMIIANITYPKLPCFSLVVTIILSFVYILIVQIWHLLILLKIRRITLTLPSK